MSTDHASSDSDDVILRPGRADDAPVIHELIQPFVTKSLLLDRSVEEIQRLTAASVVAELRGELIGFAAVEIYSQKLSEIQCLAVKEGFHQLGVGKKLVARCVEVAREKGIIELMAISSSEEFLKSCGFDYSLPGQKRALFIDPSAGRN